jgi:hypothetical protein
MRTHLHTRLVAVTSMLACSVSARVALADEPAAPPKPAKVASILEEGAQPPPPPPPVPEAPAAPPPAPAPYSLPFQLRSAAAATVVRSDTSFMRYEDANASGGFTVATTLLASWKIPGTGAPGYGLAPLVRVAAVSDSPPASVAAGGGFAVVNPLAGVTYAFPLGGGFRAAAFFGTTIPVGMGGGDTPDAGQADARSAGPWARAAMDNALFAVNDWATIPGIDVAYVGHDFTVQAEATLFELVRVRGAQAQHEATKTNFTAGLHAGWFATRMLSLGAELRYQRWIDAPFAAETGKTSVDNMTFAIGPRLHFPIGGSSWVRPGIAYSRGVDRPLAGTMNAELVQLDVPVVF